MRSPGNARQERRTVEAGEIKRSPNKDNNRDSRTERPVVNTGSSTERENVCFLSVFPSFRAQTGICIATSDLPIWRATHDAVLM